MTSSVHMNIWGEEEEYAGGVRLYVILDTSVLLSHWSFIQALHRNLGQEGAVPPPPQHPGSPEVQLLLVVPWAVLVELDKLKEERSVLRIQGAVSLQSVACSCSVAVTAYFWVLYELWPVCLIGS